MDRPALKRLLEDIQAAQAISRRGTEAASVKNKRRAHPPALLAALMSAASRFFLGYRRRMNDMCLSGSANLCRPSSALAG